MIKGVNCTLIPTYLNKSKYGKAVGNLCNILYPDNESLQLLFFLSRIFLQLDILVLQNAKNNLRSCCIEYFPKRRENFMIIAGISLISPTLHKERLWYLD